MQIIIDINSQKTSVRRGTSKTTNKPYEMTTQRGFFHSVDEITGETMPVPVNITLDQGAFPYDTGRYTIDAASLKVNEYGNLYIGRLKLSKVAAAVPAQKQA